MQQERPDRALATLERALTYDPYSEPLYREVMRLQARLGRPDAVRRTYQLPGSRLDEIDAEPSEDTRQLMTTSAAQSPTSGMARRRCIGSGGVGNEALMKYTHRRSPRSARAGRRPQRPLAVRPFARTVTKGGGVCPRG
ncbi:bacterial transcriptional activator domain-containing protein [Actinomadura meyerae]|uniref:bacterial transcriptional activator domain-containing protein n=1 Tax=Actinomadura meyerae TaxID=240840 RepID=UPI003CCC1F87